MNQAIQNTRGITVAFLASALLLPASSAAPEQAPKEPGAEGVHEAFETLFREHYPEVKVSVSGKRIDFEYHTRTFWIHEPLKSGEWQDARKTKGSKRGGVLCDITLQQGRYLGAAVVPQVFDKRYFKVLLLAPYSAKRDVHLYVHLYYPADVDAEFLKRFQALAGDFERLLR